MRLITFILFLLLPAVSLAHPIHVSVCEMKHNPEKEWLEVTLKIFTDDFEDALEDRNKTEMGLLSGDEHPKVDSFILEYIREKLIIEINGVPAEIRFISKDIIDVATWNYLYVPDVASIESITMRNDVMLHWFDDQVNVVHLDCNNKMNSTFFSHGRSEETFTFDK